MVWSCCRFGIQLGQGRLASRLCLRDGYLGLVQSFRISIELEVALGFQDLEHVVGSN